MFLSFSGGGRRPDSILIPVLCMVLGIPLLLYPGISGRLFCLGLAVGAFVYAAARLTRYFRAKRQGWAYAGDKILGIVFLCIGLFCLFFWRGILSFLPMMLGLILLFDGFLRLPMAIDTWKLRLPSRIPSLASALLPLIFGMIMVINPFSVTSLIIRFFGISLIVDGACALAAAIVSRRNNSHQDDSRYW